MVLSLNPQGATHQHTAPGTLRIKRIPNSTFPYLAARNRGRVNNRQWGFHRSWGQQSTSVTSLSSGNPKSECSASAGAVPASPPPSPCHQWPTRRLYETISLMWLPRRREGTTRACDHFPRRVVRKSGEASPSGERQEG